MKKIIEIKVKPSSGKNQIIKTGRNSLKVFLINPPSKGLANNELVKSLAEYFNIPKNNILIIKGAKFSNKLVRITIEQ